MLTSQRDGQHDTAPGLYPHSFPFLSPHSPSFLSPLLFVLTCLSPRDSLVASGEKSRETSDRRYERRGENERKLKRKDKKGVCSLVDR